MSWFKRVTAAAAATLLLAGCGFHPLNGQASNGDSTVAEMGQVKIELIADRSGQQLRNELLDRLNPNGSPRAPKYRLEVKTTETDSAIAIEKDGTASRSTLSVFATFKLVSLKSGKDVLVGQSAGVNSYSIITNSYATLVGKNDARKRSITGLADDIATRVALYFRRQQPE